MPIPEGKIIIEKRGIAQEFVGIDDSITTEVTWLIILNDTTVIYYIKEMDRVLARESLTEFIKKIPVEAIKDFLTKE